MELLPRPAAGFVGRERELAALHARFAAARTGRGGVMLLAGEPGIGKTRTAEEFARAAEAQGVRPLWGRCHEGEGAPAYWPWVQILRGYVRDRDPDALRPELGAGAPAIAQLLPDVRERLKDLPGPPALAPDQARFHLSDSVTSFLRAAARTAPLLLILDDLHWADRPSLLLLQFLARELADSCLLLVGTYRDVEVSRAHPLAPALADLARIPGCERIVLRGLVEREVAELLEGTLGTSPPPALVTAVTRETDGNLFFITEMARLLLGEGALTEWDEHGAGLARLAIPHSVREVIGRRLDGLSSASNDVLRVAAVIGRDFPLDALARVAATLQGTPLSAETHRQAQDRVLEALEEAEAASVIAAAPGGAGRYRFSHALIRETLYEELPSTRRMRLHRDVSEALERMYAADVTPHLAELAHHFVLAAPIGDAARAVSYARRAGDHAMSLFAYDAAAALYTRALEVLDLQRMAGAERVGGVVAEAQTVVGAYLEEECDLRLSLGEACRAAGDLEAARQTFTQAAALARRLDSPERLARAALGSGLDLYQAGEVNAAQLGMLQEALAAMPPEDSALRAMLLARIAVAQYSADGSEHGIALGREALAMARRAADPQVLAYVLHFGAITSGGQPADERLAISVELQRLAQATANPVLDLTGIAWQIVYLWEVGEAAEAAGAIERYERKAEQIRQPRYLFQAGVFRSAQARLAGRFDEAEEVARRALVVGQRAGRSDAQSAFGVQMVMLRLLQGRLAEVEAAVSEFTARYPANPGWRCTLAYLYNEWGRPEEAHAQLQYALAGGFADLPRDTYWLTTVSTVGEVCASVGDSGHAAALYELLLPYAGQCVVVGGGYGCSGAVARTLGLLAATLRRWDDATGHFEAALGLNERLGALPWLARTQYDYAAALLARHAGKCGPVVGTSGVPVLPTTVADCGHHEQVRTLLDDALATARQLGMARLVERTEGLLQTLAPPPPTQPPRAPSVAVSPFPDGLTAREVDVLRLIAAGKQTREIARALVVTEATVERHITNLYAKIGARGRAEATAYAFRTGLATAPPP